MITDLITQIDINKIYKDKQINPNNKIVNDISINNEIQPELKQNHNRNVSNITLYIIYYLTYSEIMKSVRIYFDKIIFIIFAISTTKSVTKYIKI